jgi:hypothetical protein
LEYSVDDSAIHKKQNGCHSAAAMTDVPDGFWREITNQSTFKKALDFQYQGFQMLIVFMMEVSLQLAQPGLVQNGIKTRIVHVWSPFTASQYACSANRSENEQSSGSRTVTHHLYRILAPKAIAGQT